MIFRLVWVMTKALLIMCSFGEVTHLVVLIWFDYIYVNTCKYTSILLLFISYICLYNYTIHICKIYCIVIDIYVYCTSWATLIPTLFVGWCISNELPVSQEGDIVNLDVVCYNEPPGAQGKDARNKDESSLVRPAQRNFVVLDAL
jgi:hypothetical protein